MKAEADKVNKDRDAWKRLVPDLLVSDDLLTAAMRLQRSANIQERAAAEALRQYSPRGIQGTGDFLTLALIWREPRITGKEIAEALLQSKGGISNRLDRYDAHDLIQRTPAPSDARSVLLTLTQRGEELIGEMYRTMVATHEELFVGLTPKQLEALSTLLAKIAVSGSG